MTNTKQTAGKVAKTAKPKATKTTTKQSVAPANNTKITIMHGGQEYAAIEAYCEQLTDVATELLNVDSNELYVDGLLTIEHEGKKMEREVFVGFDWKRLTGDRTFIEIELSKLN